MIEFFASQLTNPKGLIFKNLIIVVPITVLLFYSFSFQRRTSPLPYIIPFEIDYLVSKYYSLRPTRKVLVFTGPIKSGKTAFLNFYSKQLQSNSTFVLDFDFSQVNNKSDISGYAKLGFLNSLYSYKYKNLHQILHRYELLNHHQILNLDSSFSSLFMIFSKLVNDGSIHKILNFIESLGDILYPIIFLKGFHMVSRVSPETADTILSYLDDRNLYWSQIPILIEYTDSRIRTRFTSNSFQFIDIVSIPNMTKTLIKARAFKMRELVSVVKYLGDSSGIVESVFERMRAGLDLQTAIREETRKIVRLTAPYLNQTSKHLIKRLCSLYPMPVNYTDVYSSNGLFLSGLLWINDQMIVRSASPIVTKYLCKHFQP